MYSLLEAQGRVFIVPLFPAEYRNARYLAIQIPHKPNRNYLSFRLMASEMAPRPTSVLMPPISRRQDLVLGVYVG